MSTARRLSLLAALAVAAAFVYRGTLDAEFVNWDDPGYVTNNQRIRQLSWETVVWAFTPVQEPAFFHPLTWISLALDYRLYGLQSRGFHLTNLVLHVLNTGLVFLVWDRMTAAPWRSAVVAALFALHPMHIESVAWVTERKDVLCAFFWLLAVAAHARWARVGTATTYLLELLFLVASTASKLMAVTLPFALLLLDYWPLRRLSWRTVAEKVPLVLAVVALMAVAFSGPRAAPAIDSVTFGDRLSNMVYSLAKYLWLTVWPVGLSPWYSHRALEGPPLSAATIVGAGALLVAATAIALTYARTRPYLLVGWLWFLGTLVPSSGLIQTGRQGMADRFVYLPHIGLFVALVWTVAELPIWRQRALRAAGVVTLGIVLAALGSITVRQSRVWQNSVSLWQYTAATSPYSFVAHQAYGGVLFHRGRYPEALDAYRVAVKLRPGDSAAHSRAGLLYLLARRPGLAAAQYRKAIAANPNVAEDYYHLAEALLARGHRASARRQLDRALARRPSYPEARNLRATLTDAAHP